MHAFSYYSSLTAACAWVFWWGKHSKNWGRDAGEVTAAADPAASLGNFFLNSRFHVIKCAI